MKLFLFLILSIYCISTGMAAESTDEDILAKRGKGVVTQKAFTARADKIPANIRQSTLRNGNRFRDLINTLLLRAQLAEEARAAGFGDGEIIRERLRLAAEAELAEAWLQHYIEMQPPADYEKLASEYYALKQDTILSVPKMDVSHILVSVKERTANEAKKIADDISTQLAENPAAFDELVTKYSEDPSAASNHGSFKAVAQGDMVKPFEDAAFALAEGEISGPVKTQYGYHIIRLDALIPSTKLEFNEVKGRLMQAERRRHEERLQEDYISSLTTQEVTMTKQALEEMVRRQFGEDYIDPYAGAAKQE